MLLTRIHRILLIIIIYQLLPLWLSEEAVNRELGLNRLLESQALHHVTLWSTEGTTRILGSTIAVPQLQAILRILVGINNER